MPIKTSYPQMCLRNMSSLWIINTETLANQQSRFEKITYEYTNTNGEIQVHEREILHRPDVTCILLYDPKRKTILLTRQLRIPVYLHHQKPESLLEVCAGLIDEGEFPEHGVIREVEEETGYRISQIKKIAEAYSSPAAYTEYVHYFIGEYSPELKVNDGGGLAEEGENIQTMELPYNEAKELVLNGKIHDAKTLILLQYAIIQNII